MFKFFSLDEYKKTVWDSAQTIFLYSYFSLGEYNKTVWDSAQTIFLYSIFSFIVNIRKLFGTQPKQFSYIQFWLYCGVTDCGIYRPV